MSTTLGHSADVDPRLETAVAASVRWYDDLFAALGIPVARRGDLWVAEGTPPPYHSAVKTLAPRVPISAVLDAMAAFEHGSVADSFGDQELAAHGFELLIDAQWLHRPGTSGPMPRGWQVIKRAPWNDSVPAHAHLTFLGRFEDGDLVGGVILHDADAATGAVGVSNGWNATWPEIVAAAGAVRPGRDLVDYATGADLDAALAAGFTALGPQRVWLR